MQRKSAMIRARTTKTLKQTAESILQKLGISPSEAINMFYAQIVVKKGIPFDVNLEKDDKKERYKAVKNGKHLRSLLDLDS